MKKPENMGLILALAATLAYCGSNIGVRQYSDEGLTVWGILGVRGLLAVAAAVVAAKIFKIKIWGSNKRLLILLGFFSFLGNILLTSSITMLPLYQAVVLIYLYPAMTVPQNYFINGSKVSRRDLGLLFLTFIGCLILVWPDASAGLNLGTGHLIGFLGAFFYALGFVLTRRLGNDNSGLEPMFYYGLWAVIFCTIGIFIFGQSPGLNSPANYGQSVGLAFLAIFALLATYAALRWLPPFKVGIIGTLEIFVGALASWLIFDDPITLRAIIGGLIILYTAFKLRQA